MFLWFSFLIYAITTAITPGPNNLMSLSNGARRGFVRALPFNVGIFFGFAVITVATAVFADRLTGLLPVIKTPMLIIGALYMLYLAYEVLTDKGTVEGKEVQGGFVRGFTLQFVNPKLYVYCLVSLEAYILPVYHGKPLELFAFAMLLSFFGFACTLLWSAFGSVFVKLFTQKSRWLNIVMALLLVYCAISLFF